MTFFRILPYAAILGLTACLESDDGETIPDTPDVGLSFAELDTLNDLLIEEVTDAGPTPVADIPDTGSAIYDGTLFLALQDGSEDGVIGQAEMTASFASNTVTGGADNFYDLEGNATEGSVTYEGGAFDRSIELLSGSMNGDVAFETGEMEVGTTVVGNFSGPSAEYVSGILAGTATPAGEDDIGVLGGFYLAQ